MPAVHWAAASLPLPGRRLLALPAAIAALRPIAAGRFGDYRQQEAEALIGALEAAAGARR